MAVTIYLDNTSNRKRIFPIQICTLDHCLLHKILYVIFLWSVYIISSIQVCVQHPTVQIVLLRGPVENTSLGLIVQLLPDETFYLEYFQKKVEETVNICARLLGCGKNVEGFCKILRMSPSFGSLVNTGYNDHCDACRNIVLMILMFTILVQLEVFAAKAQDLREKNPCKDDAVFSCKWYLCSSLVEIALFFISTNVEEGFPAGIIKLDNPVLLQITPKGIVSNALLISLGGKRS